MVICMACTLYGGNYYLSRLHISGSHHHCCVLLWC
jgi:hypothetical protein